MLLLQENQTGYLSKKGENDRMKLADKLRELRINNNLTQIEVAKEFNLTKEDIRDFEEGKRTPSPALVAKFADFYKVERERLSNDCLNLYKTTKRTKEVIVFLALSMTAIFNSISVLLLLFFLDDKVTAGAEAGLIKGQYINKYFTLLFLFPFVGFYLISLFIRLNNQKNRKLITRVDAINLALETIIGLIAIIFYFNNIHDDNGTRQRLFSCLIGVLFFIVGFSLHPSINRPKAFLGFRSRFTLSNDEAWYKVNKFFSYSTIIFSVVFIIVNLFVKNYFFVFFMLIPLVLTAIYHELLRFQYKTVNL